MPTRYTADVGDGKVTELRPFAMQCARAFGALISMRDEPHDAPIPAKFEADTRWSDERIAAANERLMTLPAMTPDECENAAALEYAERLADWERRRQERAVIRQRYEDMLAKVNAWQAPEAVRNLKDFMIEQLTKSIEFDCSDTYDRKPEQQSGVDWRKEQIESASRELAYATQSRAEELARIADRNLWLDTLRTSLVGLT